MTASYPAAPPFAVFGVSDRMLRRVAALALATLALSLLLTIADGHVAAWDPAHGHVYRNGIPIPHTHPWDRAPRSDDARFACVPPAAHEDVVFTPSAEALAGASIAAPAMPAGPAAACAPQLPSRLATPLEAPAFAGQFTAVPTPPPRG